MLLTKEQELLERDQTVQVLREEASSHCTEPLKASRPLAIWKAAANSWMVKDACGISNGLRDQHTHRCMLLASSH